MKGFILEVNREEKGFIFNIVYHFVDSYLGLEYLQKTGINRKRIRCNRETRHLCTLVLVFQENFMHSLSGFLFFDDKKNSL